MPFVTVGTGVTLVALGVISYLVTGGVSLTALIPAAFGAPLALLGVLAFRQARRRLAMHGAVALGVVGFLGSARGIPMLLSLLSGGEVARPAAVIAQALMAVVCALFVALCVASFVAARRAPPLAR